MLLTNKSIQLSRIRLVGGVQFLHRVSSLGNGRLALFGLQLKPQEKLSLTVQRGETNYAGQAYIFVDRGFVCFKRLGR